MSRIAFRINGTTFISKSAILLKVSEQSCKNGSSKNRMNKSERWASCNFDGNEYFVWDTLTKKIQQQIGDIDELISRSGIASREVKEHDRQESDIELVLDLTYSQKRIFGQYRHHYENKFFFPDEVTSYAKMHALIKSIFVLQGQGYSLLRIHSVVSKLQQKLKFYNFKIGSYKYFSDKLSHLNSIGVENGIIHGNKHQPKEKKSMTRYVEKQVIHFYVQNKPRLTYKEITEKVNHEIGKRGYQLISLSAVKKFLAIDEIQNTYKPFRLGKEWAEKFLDPFLLRALPKYANDKWEIDGTVLPFYFLFNGKITRFWYIIIVDVHSRKIIAWSIGLYETRYLIMEAYMMAIVSTRALPAEIVRDNAGAYNSPEIVEIESKIEDKKCLVRPCAPRNAKDKGTVEKVHDILNCDYFSKYSEYFIGDPWNSDRELYRMSSVEIKELRKIKNTLPPYKASEFMGDVVNSYNNHPF